MKKLFYILILFSLFGCNQSAAARSDEGRSVLVNIEASGEILSVPDMAGITVNISCTGINPSISSECAKTGIDTLFALLDEQKIKKEDYLSSSIDLTKEYAWENNSQIFKGYRASSTVSIHFRNLKTMPAVITKIMTLKNATLSNLNYSHSQMNALTNSAYLKALDNAKILAEEIKKNLGAKTVEVLQISNTRELADINEPVMFKAASPRLMSAPDESATIQINPGVLKIVKNIYVQYRILF